MAHVLDDLVADAYLVNNRQVDTLFIGGGTPSLFSPKAIKKLLDGVKQRIDLSKTAEVTLEANPGTIEAERFKGFVDAGVNRFSIGVQSFQNQHLQALGRIHDCRQANFAIGQAKESRCASFNIDLMHGLPQQTVSNALSDLCQAIDHQPQHLSWYQLTIEPNTPFYSKPPLLPDDDILWSIQSQGHQLLTAAGYVQYEISGYSKTDHQCLHNLNYWRFGDYLGIGCGAHGKITQREKQQVIRTVKVKHPRGYMSLDRAYLDTCIPISPQDIVFEYFLNRFRLVEACPKHELLDYTGQSLNATQVKEFANAIDGGLIIENSQQWQVTPKGRRYLNSLLSALV